MKVIINPPFIRTQKHSLLELQLDLKLCAGVWLFSKRSNSEKASLAAKKSPGRINSANPKPIARTKIKVSIRYDGQHFIPRAHA